MNRYEKTYNLYARYKSSEKGQIGKYDVETVTCQEFLMPRPGAWRYTDKIDGMNMRIVLRRNEAGDIEATLAGRTDRAQIPGDLAANLTALIEERRELIECTFGYDLTETQGVTLYGEGYGPGIQKDGGQYRVDKGFILFDIAKWNATFDTDTQKQSINQFYLPFDGVRSLGEHLNIHVVPELFEGLGLQAVTKKVREGFESIGGRRSEGIVAQAPGLFFHYDGKLRRLKFKLKTEDFPR